jgi:hypothetical protein
MPSAAGNGVQHARAQKEAKRCGQVERSKERE